MISFSSNWVTNIEIWQERFLMPLDDPGSRLFHLNLLVSAMMVLVWAYIHWGSLSWAKARRLLLSKNYWWNSSTRIDYLLYFLNSVLKIFLLIPLLDASFWISTRLARGLVDWHGDFLGFEASFLAVGFFTLGAFVWDDLLRFGQHYLMHRIKWLWRIHSTHHSARILTPITLFRSHPLESAVATIRNGLSLGVATGLFIFIFESRVNVWTLFGVNVLGFVFNLLGANLRHSHVPIGFPTWLERIFISPLQHQIHHSNQREHFDKNFGVSLAFWDLLFKTWIASKGIGRLRFGLEGRHQQKIHREILFVEMS